MRYIDLQIGRHTVEEHYKVVEQLLNEGYRYIGNRFGNPMFYNREKKEEVCILASISEPSGYFQI